MDPYRPPPVITHSPRIYTAGSSHDRILVRGFIDGLRFDGFHVAHDWTRCEGYDTNPSPDDLLGYARADQAGVERCDVLWMITSEHASRGAATEMGMAIALGKTVIMSGPSVKANIFHALAQHCFSHHDEAYNWLRHRRSSIAKSIVFEGRI